MSTLICQVCQLEVEDVVQLKTLWVCKYCRCGTYESGGLNPHTIVKSGPDNLIPVISAMFRVLEESLKGGDTDPEAT